MPAGNRTIIALLIVVPTACQGAPAALPPRESAIPADAVKLTPAEDPFPPILHLAGWAEPAPLPSAVNTAGGEDSPFIAADGQSLWFLFTPDVSIPAQQQLLDGVTGIYQARLQEGEWGDVRRVMLQAPGQLALDGCPTLHGEALWFCSARAGYEGINWFTARQGAGWREVRYAGESFPADYEVGELHLTAAGDELYYHSTRAGGQGGYDIWVTRHTAQGWGPPENVAAVNSPETDGWPFITADGGELWFTRTVGGAPAIMRSRRTADGWGAPELALSRFAGEPTLDAAGNIYFVHHLWRDRQAVEADLYVAYRQ